MKEADALNEHAMMIRRNADLPPGSVGYGGMTSFPLVGMGGRIKKIILEI